MLTDARADVVAADADKAKGLAGIVGKLVELHSVGDGVASDEFVGDREVLLDELVHGALNVGNLLGSGADGEVVVDFRLLALDVRVLGALAAKHSHHGLVEKVLGGVGWTVLVLVVGVKYWLFHVVLRFCVTKVVIIIINMK